MEDSKLQVTEESDGSLTIEWQDDHPFASILETWTEEQWIEAIRLGNERAKKVDNGE